MTFLRQSAAVAGKDLRIEVRGRYALGAVLPFAATLLVAFGLSLGPDRVLLQRTAPGLLWLAVLFDAVFGPDIVNHSAGGDSSTVPSAVVVALFAFLATWVVAWFGFRRDRKD